VIPTLNPPKTMAVAISSNPDPVAAARDLIDQLGTDQPLYVLFVTEPYPRAALAVELGRAWGQRLIGCTSAGNIGPNGFESAPVLAVALQGRDLAAHTLVIEPLSDLPRALERALPALERALQTEAWRDAFGLLLIDGLPMMEEPVAASLKSLLGGIPLIGGSAGGNPAAASTRTEVLADGAFSADRATLTLVSTPVPFRVFRLHHYEAQETILVITAASPDRRLVHEINGQPAAAAIADAIGVEVAELGSDLFSMNPLVLRAGGESWVRSIAAPLPDGSLQFFAAIDTGAVLRPGRAMGAESILRQRLESIRQDLGGSITGLFVLDCLLRRIEFSRSGTGDAIERALVEYPVAGFNTYGEQFDDFHMNQTMVGVAFGDPAGF
jgi:hypothetical protein